MCRHTSGITEGDVPEFCALVESPSTHGLISSLGYFFKMFSSDWNFSVRMTICLRLSNIKKKKHPC